MWLQVPLSSSQCALLLSCASISRINLLFSRVLFSFLELPFCFSDVPFYFSKMPCCFPELLFSFPELPFFFYCARLFPRMFFPTADCTFLPCSELLRKIILALLLFCFLLEFIIDQFMTPS